MIGLDTFSWYKFITLYNDEWKILMTDILNNYNIFITHEVKKEFEYRFEKYLHILDLIIILPRKRSSTEYDRRKFDLADISLLQYAEITDYVIITEDHPMLSQGITQRKNIMQFCDFVAALYKEEFLDLTDYYQIVKKLREMKNITKTKEKELISKNMNK
jgi:hypothetical protein